MKPRIPLPAPLDDRAFSALDGIAAGLSRGRMRGRDLVKPFRGVYVRASDELDYLQRCAALLQKVPPYAFLSGVSAARVIAMPLPRRIEASNVVDIAVHAPGSPPEGEGIRGYELELDESEIQLWAGMAVTSPEETWCSLGSQLSIVELVAAGDFLIHRGAPITSREALATQVGRWTGKRGVRKLRRALELLSDRSESPRESELRVLVIEAGMAGLEVNFPIRTVDGYDYRADLAFPSRKLIVEYQSAFHETPESFRADMTRVSRLEAEDWKVMQINRDDMKMPSELAARIARVLHARPHF